jgi:hypothetical protein
MESFPSIPDLIIEECIPSCAQCPLTWINEYTGHRIACKCKRCNHGTEQNTQSLAIRISSSSSLGLPTVETDTKPSSQQNLGVLSG